MCCIIANMQLHPGYSEQSEWHQSEKQLLQGPQGGSEEAVGLQGQDNGDHGPAGPPHQHLCSYGQG